MMTVFVDNMKLRAHHGVLEQERVVGADFSVSVRVECCDDVRATLHDQLDGTVSYADICAIIRREMLISSNLLENVAMRIGKGVLAAHNQAEAVWVRVVKLNPPMGADVDGAGVEMYFLRK